MTVRISKQSFCGAIIIYVSIVLPWITKTIIFSRISSIKLNGEKSYWNAHANNRELKRLRNTYSPVQKKKWADLVINEIQKPILRRVEKRTAMPENKYYIFFVFKVTLCIRYCTVVVVAFLGYTLRNKDLVFECDPENHYFRDSLAGGNERRTFPKNLRSRPFLEKSNVILLLAIQGRRKRECYRKFIIDRVQQPRLINAGRKRCFHDWYLNLNVSFLFPSRYVS